MLERRRIGTAIEVAIELPVKEIKTAGEAPEGFEGITELIGKATTTFTGSPKNRIHNIKNGARLLTGHVIKPGEEFSTLAALGKVDNTTGYLPELVIKGTRTVPEFGGGLCQVSTTLFRSLLNAGLPITARRNHSYRVSYYEKDENGKFIGPGLDATIYQSNPDLKFKNDTAHPILVYGYVYGDKITFELYGTRDGRTSKIEGPTLLTETAAGPPIYAETDTLPRGTVKQVEVAHPGGSTKALYSVTYPDGRVENQEFKSFYRRWPARFLVGTKDQQAAAQ
jgi:vancomycin resistance protein YoaR